jgi:hypothetical protein
MTAILDKVKVYLEAYLSYDWRTFNSLELKEQCQKWRLLKSELNDFLEKENGKTVFNFEDIYALIRSYSDKFYNLPIEGKLYVKVNSRLLEGQLIKIVKEIEYQEVLKAKELFCECELLSQFGKAPKSDNLIEIGILNDSYYMPKLLECKICKFLWNKYISDGSDGRIIFEKHNPEDDRLVVYHD